MARLTAEFQAESPIIDPRCWRDGESLEWRTLVGGAGWIRIGGGCTCDEEVGV